MEDDYSIFDLRATDISILICVYTCSVKTRTDTEWKIIWNRSNSMNLGFTNW